MKIISIRGILSSSLSVFRDRPYFMNLQEAKQFVSRFMKGDSTSEEHYNFRRWLLAGTIKDLIEILKAQEAVLDITFTLPGPPAKWIGQMEAKLDKIQHDPDVAKEKEAPCPTLNSKESSLFFQLNL